MKVLNFLGVGLLAIGTVTITPVSESPAIAQEFPGVNRLILNLDGLNFYWEGPPIYPTSTRDIPGPDWTQISPTTLTAPQGNIGLKTELAPEGISNWWSSDAPACSLLYTAEVIIHEWTSQIFNRAIYLEPNSAAIYNHRGSAYFRLNQYEKALADFNQALSLEPNYADAYYNRGLLQVQLGNLKAARANFQKAQQLYNLQGNAAQAEKIGEALKLLP